MLAVRNGCDVASKPIQCNAKFDAWATKAPPVITNVREMDIVLPRKVRVLHVDYEREYDAGEQYAERLNTDAVNVRSVELAIVLTATTPAGRSSRAASSRTATRSASSPCTHRNIGNSRRSARTSEAVAGNARVPSGILARTSFLRSPG